MSLPNPVDRQWLSNTLTPYLCYAFSHVLRRTANVKPYLQRALDICESKPNCSSQDDDVLFEHVLQTIERRQRGLPVQSSIITDNVEALAQFLIRRAQVKGQYELPGRGALGGGEKLQADNRIDPRLRHALPGQFASSELSGTLSVAEDQFYQQKDQNCGAFPIISPPRAPRQLPPYYDKPTTNTLASHGNSSHQQRRGPVSEPGPQQGFGVLIPGGRRTETVYNQIVNGQPRGNIIAQRNEQAWSGYLVTTQEPAHSGTSTRLLQVASTPTTHVHAPYAASQRHTQNDELVSQHRQLLQAIFPNRFSEQYQGQETALMATANLPYRHESAIPSIPNWSTAAELGEEMAAFRKLPRQDKTAKLTNILTAIQAKHPEKIMHPTRNHGAPAGARRVTRQEEKRREDVTRAIPSAQAHLPEPQQQVGLSGSRSGMAEVVYHPGYSDVRYKFEAPSFDSVKDALGAHVQVKEEGD